jgi:hypothetical protein
MLPNQRLEIHSVEELHRHIEGLPVGGDRSAPLSRCRTGPCNSPGGTIVTAGGVGVPPYEIGRAFSSAFASAAGRRRGAWG